MKYSLSALTLVLLLLISAATGAVLTNLTIAPSSNQEPMMIETSSTYGENVYTLIEVDDGDNDEDDDDARGDDARDARDPARETRRRYARRGVDIP